MKPRGERKKGDAVYFVGLREVGTAASVALGNFWAHDAAEAIERAQKFYPIFFKGDAPARWSVRVERLETGDEGGLPAAG